MPRNLIALRLLVLGLIGLLQFVAVATIGSAFKAASSTSSSQLVDEEELDDDTMTEEVETFTVEHPAGLRWSVVEQYPPAPVHLERESRPPSA